MSPTPAVSEPAAERVAQPPLLALARGELTAVLGGLALGGAERIVIDWAVRVQSSWPVHLIVLRNHPHEWPVPPGVRVTRLGGLNAETTLTQLTHLGREAAHRGPAAVLCHLLTETERRALAAGGARVVSVVHNARAGWLERASALDGDERTITVSDAAAEDLRRDDCRTPISVIRHIPRPRRVAPDARATWRRVWRIPGQATVVGMIGAVKPQKNYPFAIHLLQRLLADRDLQDLYLVIVGGPIGRNGRTAWHAVLDEMRRCGVRQRLAMPGFVPDAAACLPAFDLLLNTSLYEGTSMATLEALVNGVPVVASRVGGQGELPAEGLTLVDKDASLDDWAAAVRVALARTPSPPDWTGFPSYRLWTLAHLAVTVAPTDRVLMITANLNAGGAQRSLVNLASSLRETRFELAVTGDSTADYFLNVLRTAGVALHRTATTRDPFDHAEQLVHRVVATRIGTVCFWNVDPKIKLLVTQALAHTRVALVDVSPGPSSFDEMRQAAGFARLIAFSEDDYYRRLDRLIMKFTGPVPAACIGKIDVIPNGVAAPARPKASYAVTGPPRVVVNGRIAPTKFLVEIIEAMALVRAMIPDAELHVFGYAEPRHTAYEEHARRTAGAAIDTTVFFHERSRATLDHLVEFDAFVVIGQDQGCPNALLEALAAGLPCIANDDGGTGEQIIDERTGMLVHDREPATIARAIVRVLADRPLAERLGRAGREHALRSFSLQTMVSRYDALFASLAARARSGNKERTE